MMTRIAAALIATTTLCFATPDPLAWPPLTRETKPWAYNWWMASAVDKTNLTKELTRYRDGGLGGIHIIPIYGAKGFEDKYISYLSPQWMEMLDHTVTEARRLGMDVDMTTGTGWCFGGKNVTDDEANASVVARTFQLAAGERLTEKFDRKTTQALMAFPSTGKPVDLLDSLNADGELSFSPSSGTWRVIAVSQRPSGQQVKRAAPGGQGHMLNLIYPQAMTHFLEDFTAAFNNYKGAKPRAQYHDSYEYRSDWSPDFFAHFEKRRGYKLQNELPALFADYNRGSRRRGDSTNSTADAAPAMDPDRIARVKSDYRETISDVMAEESLPMWVEWSHKRGFITRNEAHGSPGNWLDLYAVADIPETEMFRLDRNLLVSKFASSAAHVAGRKLASSETATWLKEHFTETLADVKYLFDDMFLSGINHMFYHGTIYSPDEAPWPGWVFYASTEMNPRNPIWHDAPALNLYASRCQAILQSGKPANDVLMYWPIYDYWHNSTGLTENVTVHGRGWFEGQPVGKAAERLWARGFGFDYISDRQLAAAKNDKNEVTVPGGNYRAIVVPRCQHMPVTTLSKLMSLAASGATVVFEFQLPGDVAGWGNLEARRLQFRKLTQGLKFTNPATGVSEARVGKGRVFVGSLEGSLVQAGIRREALVDNPGLHFIRRTFDNGHHYFIANRGERAFEGWLPLSTRVTSVVAMDPLSGAAGVARLRQPDGEKPQVYAQIPAGGSIILRAFTSQTLKEPLWSYWKPEGQARELNGEWAVKFTEGGPTLPPDFRTTKLGSWTAHGEQAQRFGGTARYSLTFDSPEGSTSPQILNLGKVGQSARVRLNGHDFGTLITPPFQVVAENLKPTGNRLEVEVTSVPANRIRDMDRRGEVWQTFHDINFVNQNYRPFNASDWPLTDCGLLGPVTLTTASR